MVRRLKGELRKHLGSQIPERDVVQINLAHLPEDAPELVLSEKLHEYTEILERRLANAPNRTKAAGKLVTIALQKRLLSSIEAFARTLAVHRKNAAEKLLTSAPKSTTVTQAPLFDGDEDLTDELLAEMEDVAVARATQEGAAAADDARARVLLEEMSHIAEQARGEPDAKMRWLVDWIRYHQCPDMGKQRKAAWRPRRILLFTEYADTKNYLVRELEAAIAGTDLADERILTLHGGMDEESRERVKQAFNDATHPVRILIGTDAAREGVNLQAQCADLFHYDLPWNPGRMEQRNGRIDRMLQPEKVVRCHYFVYAQRTEDAVLEALVKKTERIRTQLGSLADVIEKQLAGKLKGGITRARASELVQAITSTDAKENLDPVVEEELEQSRDKEIVAQLEELQKLDQKAAEHLDLRPERLRDVVNVGLKLARLPLLAERKESPGTFDVPPLDKLTGTDATWRDIMDTLRAPRTRKMPEWEWRAKNAPRPVSFEPSTTLASETVQLHLQHKLTQRVLAMFRAQAFGEDRLSRVTVIVDPTHRRHRILALGRLSLYGPGASRLHEELLVVAAYWAEGDDASRLKPFETADAEDRALESLDAVLGRENQAQVAEHIVDKLMQSATKDEDTLWETLKAKAGKRVIWAEEKLRLRGTVEAEEMQRILLAQKKLIQKTLKERQPANPNQIEWGWAKGEEEQKAQHEADTRHMEKRSVEIEKELDSEPRRIREQYEVKHHRLERVGLVYLWPATS